MALSRRSFIRWVLAAGAGLSCPLPGRAQPASGSGEKKPRLRSEDASVCHRVRDGDAMPAPAPARRVDLVIVGGGPSGLAAAVHAQGSDFLLLEKEDHLGGNAFAEEWQGLRYCTGSAWATLFSPEVEQLFKRWELDLKPIQGLDAACFNGTWIPGFWDGNPESPVFDRLPFPQPTRDSFRRFLRDVAPIDLETEGPRLDATSFAELLKPYAPEIAAYWDTFGPSNWGAKAADTSAYLGVQAARDWSKWPRLTWEGGLGVGSERLYARLSEADKRKVVLGAAAYSVERKGKKAVVRYVQGGEAHAVEAKAVVMATPKFITWRLVQGLPEKQRKAMAAMRYAPFMVYNLCFDRVVYNQAYENFVVGAKHFTDFVPADYVTHAQGGDLSRKQVITVYAPKAEAERHVFLDDAATLAQAEAAVDELGALLPGWSEHLAEVRVYRRGHAMPMSAPGVLTRLQPASRRDHGNVFFAHSDSDGDVSDFAYAALNGVEAASKALRRL
ncbi:MAG: FAD-dependent oxidoreductase [Elusimicrobia bacterium]|nr:FAD-dependent oxidoreductase [Elusimicrobiota bacterium]